MNDKINEKMHLQNLFFLIVILFAAFYFFGKKEVAEEFENQIDEKIAGSKACSQKSINDSYNYYTFGSPHFVR